MPNVLRKLLGAGMVPRPVTINKALCVPYDSLYYCLLQHIMLVMYTLLLHYYTLLQLSFLLVTAS